MRMKSPKEILAPFGRSVASQADKLNVEWRSRGEWEFYSEQAQFATKVSGFLCYLESAYSKERARANEKFLCVYSKVNKLA